MLWIAGDQNKKNMNLLIKINNLKKILKKSFFLYIKYIKYLKLSNNNAIKRNK